jgi:SAM-dependent methyltransferase
MFDSIIKDGVTNLFREILGKFRRLCVYGLNKFSPIKYVNIGGGPWFAGFFWCNLEACVSPVNPCPFIISSDCVFPFPDNSVDTVYNSHNLEHLNQLVADRVLTEAHRILKPGGHLVLKLPDFDRVLESWKGGDDGYIAKWSFSPGERTWKNRKVSDSLDTRIAMIFCGFWNDAYGDQFLRKFPDNPSAYFGPPVVSAEILNRLKTYDSPHLISQELRSYVVENELSYTFCHQNAWSRDEFRDLLVEKNFQVISMNAKHVIKECVYVPGIREMEDISMYILSEKLE